jgi:hypothetical protein
VLASKRDAPRDVTPPHIPPRKPLDVFVLEALPDDDDDDEDEEEEEEDDGVLGRSRRASLRFT